VLQSCSVPDRIVQEYIRSAAALAFADWPNCCAIAFMSCDWAEMRPGAELKHRCLKQFHDINLSKGHV
jgi:hypothetical protein